VPRAAEPSATDVDVAELRRIVDDVRAQLDRARDRDRLDAAWADWEKRTDALGVFAEVGVSDPRSPQALDEISAALSDGDVERVYAALARLKGRRVAVRADRVQDSFPQRAIWAPEMEGALASVGEVTLLSGEGKIGKSTLVCDIAVGMALLDDGAEGAIGIGMMGIRGGAVLIASAEDGPGVVAERVRALGAKRSGDGDPVRRVYILDLRGRPIFRSSGHHDDERGRTAQWADLWREARRVRPGLVVVDPALGTFAGDSNAPGPVREFVGGLAGEAGEIGACVLLVAHSTKEARSRGHGAKTPHDQVADLLDPGMVGGTTHWSDAARGVLTMARHGNTYRLGVPVANYGPSRIWCAIRPVTSRGVPVGFDSRGSWQKAGSTTRSTKAPEADATHSGPEQTMRPRGSRHE